ncbi:MAG TPA: hypothetical protein VGF59_00145, partial [Bryobacteraceae bacterium]
RWLLYAALVNGRRDVYARSVQADGRGPWQISPSGGSQPAWRADGKEVFYIAANGTMTAVPVEVAGDDLRPGTPTALFPTEMTLRRGAARDYDVTPDGKRFLLALPQSAAHAEAPITVIINWPKLLEKR